MEKSYLKINAKLYRKFKKQHIFIFKGMRKENINEAKN